MQSRDQTKLTPATTNVAINVDCLPPVVRQEAEVITGELADLVEEFCGGQVKYSFLDASRSEVDI